ncbi:MAG TPA: hypothetical protein VF870_09400, partial [Ignavibacteriaceae bacterium]
MRSLQKVLGIILLSIFTFSACNENVSDPLTPVSNASKSLAKQVDVQKYQRIAKVMAANNIGQGAYFMEPTDAGYRLGLAKDVVIDWSTFTFISGEFAEFAGSYGKGDFWRQNPDGTVSVKLTTNQAIADYFNIETGEYYAGTGNMNTKFTYTSEEYCYYDEVLDSTFCFTFLFEDPSNNAWVIHGNAALTLDGAGGNSRMLQMWWNINPGGGWENPHIDFNLK